MSNEWRTLKEILDEGKFQIWLEAHNGVKAFFVGPDENGNAVLSWESTGVRVFKHDLTCWRIHEEPKQPKKWAPAWIMGGEIGKPYQPNYIYYSADHVRETFTAEDGYIIIWPAPGFTPVEIPE